METNKSTYLFHLHKHTHTDPDWYDIYFFFLNFDLVGVWIKCDVWRSASWSVRRRRFYIFCYSPYFCVHLPSLFFCLLFFFFFFLSHICHYAQSRQKPRKVAFIDLVSRPFFPSVSSFLSYLCLLFFPLAHTLFHLLIVFTHCSFAGTFFFLSLWIPIFFSHFFSNQVLHIRSVPFVGTII